MARDPGCNSPLPMLIVLAANKLLCGLFEKIAMKFYDRREKKQNKAAVAAVSASSMFTISLMCLVGIAALVPTAAAAATASNNNTAVISLDSTTAIPFNSTAIPTPIPVNIRLPDQIPAHTQSCKCHQGLLWTYKIHIGELYNDGMYCGKINDVIGTATSNLDSLFRCKNDGNGDISIRFNVLNGFVDADALNKGLEKVFPDVNGFNCPAF